ncbi:hypothetical protein [Arcobacter sp.]|uniref:hypothetical protein n=1 Tax=Arcobacter sp. TaxID=1872629 RepID=UPI003D13D2E7
MKEKMKAMILNLLKEKRSEGISFAQIENMFDDNNIDYNGDHIIRSSKYKKIYYWLNMSDDFSRAIIELRKEDKIEFSECNVIIYLADGKIIKDPLARKAIEYKEPHWLPVLIKMKEVKI